MQCEYAAEMRLAIRDGKTLELRGCGREATQELAENPEVGFCEYHAEIVKRGGIPLQPRARRR